MVALGFEPRHLSVMGLESIALDHSAKLPCNYSNKFKLINNIIYYVRYFKLFKYINFTFNLTVQQN